MQRKAAQPQLEDSGIYRKGLPPSWNSPRDNNLLLDHTLGISDWLGLSTLTHAYVWGSVDLPPLSLRR